MIDQIAGFLQRNLVVFLAFLVLPLKWGVVRFWGDKEAEAGAIMAIPEDICYVVLGLVLGDVISSKGAFRRHFSASSRVDLDITVTVALGFFFALLIHPLSQIALRNFRGWRAAQAATASREAENVTNAADNFMTLTTRHMLLFLLAYGGQVGIIYPWIHWIARVIGESSGL
jgi:hypothetical protein